MSDVSERGGELPEPGQLIEMVQSLQPGGSFVFLRERLYCEVQVKHPRNARFSLRNEQGLFFVKVYQAVLVDLAQSFEAGTKLGVVGEMHSFVNRHYKNHHVFIIHQGVHLLWQSSPPTQYQLRDCYF